MSKRHSKENAHDGKAAIQAAPGKPPTPSDSNTGSDQSASTPQSTEGSAGSEKTRTAAGTEVMNALQGLDANLQKLVNKLLEEGSTFEDVVEAVNARGGKDITLNAVKTYFQGNRELQTQRALRQVEDSEALLASLDKNPKSAEARLARATFLTGYSRVNRNASVVNPREAARYRMECENLDLKRQILTFQRKKAKQDLAYSRARTNLIEAMQGKVQGELLMLERQLRAHHAGDPIGEELLQRIQQLYGLCRQPLLYEETVDAITKAEQAAR
jgi:hypothetical protein